MKYKSYRYCLVLNNETKHDLANHFGCVRWVYNHFLYERKNLKEGVYLNHGDMQKSLTSLKKEFKWLNNVSNMSLQGGLIDLTDAYKRMAIGNGYPKYKDKYDEQSCRFNNYITNPKTYPTNSIQVDFKKHKVLLPKLGWLNFHRSSHFKSKIVFATVMKETDGKYYISLTVEENIKKIPPVQKEIGIDLGLKSYIVGSDGMYIEAPKFFRKSKKELKKQQQKLSRKKLNSNRYNKQKHVVAKLHKKIAHQRNDFLHKLTSKLINENQVICLETLKVKNMLQNHCLALSISDAGWSEYIRQLTYKADWYERIILKIDTFEPSTKNCHNCGYKNNELTLKDREWTCPKCGKYHIRDFNSAINILCVAKCPDIEVVDVDKEIKVKRKRIKSCKKVASTGSANSGCRIPSNSEVNEASS